MHLQILIVTAHAIVGSTTLLRELTPRVAKLWVLLLLLWLGLLLLLNG